MELFPLKQVKWLCRSENIGGLLCVLFQLCCGCAAHVVDVGGKAEGVFACGSEPLGILFVVGGEVADRDSHRKGLALTWGKRTGLGKRLQFL